MTLDARAKRFLDLLAAGNASMSADAPVAARRAGLVELLKFGGPPPEVGAVHEFSLPGPAGRLPVRVYSPLTQVEAAAASTADPLAVPLPGIVYFHGGGLVAGSIESHDSIARALANAGACRVASVEYRLAPEFPFPAALEDARAAVHYISAHAVEFGIDPERLGICGDSAGGTLAAAACQWLAAEPDAGACQPMPTLLVLICPILDHSRSSASWRTLAHGYLVDSNVLEHDLKYYAPGWDVSDHRISPLRAERLAGMPRTCVHTAEYDPLRDEGREYFDRLSHAGCEVSYTCHSGMIHLFYGLGSVIPYARTALGQIGAEIRAALKRKET